MNKKKIIIAISLILLSVFFLMLINSCKKNKTTETDNQPPSDITETSKDENESTSETTTSQTDKSYQSPAIKLAVKNITKEVFDNSVANAKEYTADKKIVAGVIPHHTVAAPLIAGFFKSAADKDKEYDTVIIVSPNHTGDIGDVVISYADWDFGDGVLCDRETVGFFEELNSTDFKVKINDKKLETEHSASVLIPYVNHYFPKAKVAPILLTDNLSLDSIMNFSRRLSEYINRSYKNILLICSVDFSHYLTTSQAKEKDKETLLAIQNADYLKIKNFGNENLDSSAALMTFMKFVTSYGSEMSDIKNMDNTDMSEFEKKEVVSTTSYFVFLLEEKEMK